jgi:hypothetical protein
LGRALISAALTGLKMTWNTGRRLNEKGKRKNEK